MFATWGPRVLAPLFLVACVIAVLSVVNANEGGSSTGRGAGGQERGASNGGGGGGEDTGGEDSGGDEEGSGEETYTVESGDFFSTIAEEAGISTQRLERLNPDVDPTALQPGQVLKLR